VASVLDLDETLTEALALAHDIGHPPFGHAGEEALNHQMAAFGRRFDHNLHALTIVESFERRYPQFPGLNLTFEIREGIVKHSSDFRPGECPELAEYLPDKRPPLEAQLIDPVDEIAYSTADLDDAYSAGFFSVVEITEAVPEYARIWASVQAQFPRAPEEVQFSEALRWLVDHLISGLIEGTCAAAENAGVGDVQAVRDYPQRLAQFAPPAASTIRALKTFLHSRVYSSEAIQQACKRHASAVVKLFQVFMQQPHLISHQPERTEPQHSGDSSQRPLNLLVCNYIAGMTDTFFCRTYESLLGVMP
jgi:dGTPase